MTLASGRTKAHTVSTSLEELPRLTCFRSKIGQVLTNLLANAADALSEKRLSSMAGTVGERGEFTFRARRSWSGKGVAGVLVAVADNGDGVPATIRERIFE